MANLVVTSSLKKINVVFNDSSTRVGRSKGSWDKEDIRFDLSPDSSHIVVTVRNSPQWEVSYNSHYIIDSVDGVGSFASNSALYDALIKSLRVNSSRIVPVYVSGATWNDLQTALNSAFSNSTKEYVDSNSFAIVALSDEFYAVILEYV